MKDTDCIKVRNKRRADYTAYERHLSRDAIKAAVMTSHGLSDCLLTDYVRRHPLYVRRLGNNPAIGAAYEKYLLGDDRTRSPVRPDNRALAGLLTNYTGRHPNHIRRLGNDLPIYGDLLYGIALKETGLILHTWDAIMDESGQYGLSLSVFDFILSIYCDRMFQFLDHDRQAPLLLANALLFQVTGEQPGLATEEDILYMRSHSIRGIQKFLLITQMRRKQTSNVQVDPRSWLLGAETAHILCGGSHHSVEHQVIARTALLRYDASAIIKFLLYNETPNNTERTVLEKQYEEALNNSDTALKYSRQNLYDSAKESITPEFTSTNKNANQRSDN
ncbi:MAG TPA: hypothetical protein VHO84_06745 [Syntrophorhabdaceae bacterium]|nr:hypothetical protein [Syntrophorhabdaceae bacterium]